MLVFAGIKNCVVALDAETGGEVWRTTLYNTDFITIMWDGTALFAANGGEVWRLDPATGSEIWKNEMTGLGRGLISLASSRAAKSGTDDTLYAEKVRLDALRAAAAAG